MATLNNQWQELSRGTLRSGIDIVLVGLLISQDVNTNTSVVSLALVSFGTSWRTSNGTATFTGAFGDSGGCATYPNYITDGYTIFKINKTIEHETDGSKSFNIGAVVTAVFNDGTKTANIPQVSVSLPQINRTANITYANDFNDEQNPSFLFNNQAGYRINARLEFAGTYIGRENIANTGSYTFELTTAERNLLRQNCTGKTLQVTYVLATCYSGTTESAWSTLTKTMSIVNANPTFNVTYQDSNLTTTAITQNNQQIIQNNSTLQFNITNATAYKYASLSSVEIVINGVSQTKSISSSTLTFNFGTINVASDTSASVVLTDSRGFIRVIGVDLTILSWNTPNANITLQRKSNYYTETDIKVDANYSSLDSKNTIAIKYRIKKKSDSTWSSYSNLSDNVTSTFNADNLYEWDVQVVVTDLLGSVTYNLSLGIGTPILFVDRTNRNVGIDCFAQSTNALEVKGTAQVNGDLLIADSGGNNPVNVLDKINGLFKIKKYTGSITVGGNAFQTLNMGSLSSISGYTFVGILPNQNGFGDQWVVSYGLYGGNVQAMVHSGYSGSLTANLTCYVIWVKTDYYNTILTT